MDRFDAMRLFTRIVELRSFTQAAHDLGYPKATVTHAIKQLEARLRVRLLQRTTRQVTPTPDGEAYYQRCARLLADLEETEAVFSSAARQPAGKLRVDLHATLAMHFVMPVLDQFCGYPLIELEIGMGDRLVDLVREGVDCVLRVGELSDSSMARRVALLEQVTCASPAYLGRARHAGESGAARWPPRRQFLLPRRARPGPSIKVDASATAWPCRAPSPSTMPTRITPAAARAWA